MKLTLTIYAQDSGGLLHSDSWHLPNDLPAWLGEAAVGEAGRRWESAPHDLRPPQIRLECRWVIEPCACLSCQIPASAGQDLALIPHRARRETK